MKNISQILSKHPDHPGISLNFNFSLRDPSYVSSNSECNEEKD